MTGSWVVQGDISIMQTATSPFVAIPSSPGRVTEQERETRRSAPPPRGPRIQQPIEERGSKNITRAGSINFLTLGALKRRRSPFQYRTAPAALSVTTSTRVWCAMRSISSSSPLTSSRLITTAFARASAASASCHSPRHAAFRVPLTHPALWRETSRVGGKRFWQYRYPSHWRWDRDG